MDTLPIEIFHFIVSNFGIRTKKSLACASRYFLQITPTKHTFNSRFIQCVAELKEKEAIEIYNKIEDNYMPLMHAYNFFNFCLQKHMFTLAYLMCGKIRDFGRDKINYQVTDCEIADFIMQTEFLEVNNSLLLFLCKSRDYERLKIYEDNYEFSDVDIELLKEDPEMFVYVFYKMRHYDFETTELGHLGLTVHIAKHFHVEKTLSFVQKDDTILMLEVFCEYLIENNVNEFVEFFRMIEPLKIKLDITRNAFANLSLKNKSQCKALLENPSVTAIGNLQSFYFSKMDIGSLLLLFKDQNNYNKVNLFANHGRFDIVDHIIENYNLRDDDILKGDTKLSVYLLKDFI